MMIATATAMTKQFGISPLYSQRLVLMEVLLLESAEHVKMARVQQLLYQQKVAMVVKDAVDRVDHSLHTYTFVVNYGKNLELPIYNNEQLGCTYYFIPLSV